MKMLPLMCGEIKQDNIRNDTIRECRGIIYSKNEGENRLMWFEHVDRSPVDYEVRRVNKMDRSQTTRDRRRSRKTLREVIKKYL